MSVGEKKTLALSRPSPWWLWMVITLGLVLALMPACGLYDDFFGGEKDKKAGPTVKGTVDKAKQAKQKVESGYPDPVKPTTPGQAPPPAQTAAPKPPEQQAAAPKPAPGQPTSPGQAPPPAQTAAPKPPEQQATAPKPAPGQPVAPAVQPTAPKVAEQPPAAKPVGQAPPAAPKAEKPGAAKPVAAKPGAAKPVVESTEPPKLTIEMIRQRYEAKAKEYTFDPSGRLDPFKPITALVKALSKGEAKEEIDDTLIAPLQRLELSQIKLLAVIQAGARSRALVSDTAGKGYIVQIGTPIGNKKGRVSEIQSDRIIVVQEAVSERGIAMEKPYELKLRTMEGEKK